MGFEHDAYHDEDLVVVDPADLIAAASIEKSEPPFLKAFRQVESTIRNGGFCKNIPKEEKSKEPAAKVAIGSPTPAVEDLDSDEESEDKERSVTFRDLADPLIVAEEEEAIETAEVKTPDVSEIEIQTVSKESKKVQSFFAISMSIVVVTIAIASISFAQPDAVKLLNPILESETAEQVTIFLSPATMAVTDYANSILESETAEKAADFLSTATVAAKDYAHFQYKNIAAIDNEHVQYLMIKCEEYPVAAGLTAFAGTVVGFKTLFAILRMTKLATIFESIWGSLVCLMITVGIYHTYN